MDKTFLKPTKKGVSILLIAIGLCLSLAYCCENSWPKNAIREAKALIPRIAEIKPYMEENWILIDQVNQVLKEHPEIKEIFDNETSVICRMEDRENRDLSEIESLSAEEKQTISTLFDGSFPYTMSLGVIYTGVEGDNRLMRIDVLYIPENDLSWCHEGNYYMEELVPDWYACTSIVRMVRGIGYASFQAQREDGGLVRLSQEDRERFFLSGPS